MSDAPPDAANGGLEPKLDWSAFPVVDAATWRARVEKDLEGRPFDKLRAAPFEGVSVDPLYDQAPSVPDRPGEGDRVRGNAAQARGWVIAPSFTDDAALDLAQAIAHDVTLGAGAAWVTCTRRPSNAAVGGWLEAVGKGELFVEVAVPTPLADGCVAVIDPLSAMARRGDDVLVDDAVRAETARVVGLGSAEFGIDTSVYANAGAEVPEQLGLLLATGAAYLRWCDASGVDLGAAASTAWASLAVGRDFFAEIAKLRAARRLWSRLCAACGVGASQRGLRIRAVGSRRERTRRDPWVNLLRGTTETFAAAVGGAQLIATLPLDAELPGHPSCGADFGRRLAVNTQVLLREESHLGRIVDPAGGSYYVESLTDALARAGWEAFRRIEGEGGIETALRSGAAQARISAMHARAAGDVARRKLAIVGVAEFPILEQSPVPGETTDLGASDSTPPGACAIEALPVRRLAEPFEELRDRSDACVARHGERPKALTLGLGPLAVHKPRADFAHNLLLAGGFEVVVSDALDDVDQAIAAVREHAPPVAVLCSSDELYAERVVAVVEALAALPAAPTLVLAGRAGALAHDLKAAGLAHELYLGCDAVALLDALLTVAEERSSS